MSWEHFVVGLRVMQHEEGRRFLGDARATRVAGAVEKDYKAAMRDESRLLGLR